MESNGLGFFARPIPIRVQPCANWTKAAVGRLQARVCGAMLAVALLAGFLRSSDAVAQAEVSAQLDRPATNEALRGSIQIIGTATAPAFESADLTFSYLGDETNTWFWIDEVAQPVTEGTLATWDTTVISDGDYILRLRVNSLDGTYQDAQVEIQVRNYTAAEAAPATATATAANVFQVPTAQILPPEPTRTPQPLATPTLLPPNPIRATESAVVDGFLQGALVVAGLVLLLGIILLRRQS